MQKELTYWILIGLLVIDFNFPSNREWTFMMSAFYDPEHLLGLTLIIWLFVPFKSGTLYGSQTPTIKILYFPRTEIKHTHYY